MLNQSDNDTIEYRAKNTTTVLYLTVLLLLTFQQTIAQEHKTFVAKNGDAIYSILQENNIPSTYFNAFVALNKSNLNSKLQLYIGKEYLLPNTDTLQNATKPDSISIGKEFCDTIIAPILGEKHKKIKLLATPDLKNAIFYLDAGHGGPDPGAIAKYNNKTLCEDEYAYDITLRLYRNLLSLGATVYLITRDNNDGIRDGWYLAPDKDETCYPDSIIPINLKKRLKQRTDVINDLYSKQKTNYQRLLIIHVDSRSKKEKIDVFFYYDPNSKNGKIFAENLRQIFDQKYLQHQPGRGYQGNVSERELYMLQKSKPVATFIELGNIHHERDINRLIVENNRQALANWLTDGIIHDYTEHKTP